MKILRNGYLLVCLMIMLYAIPVSAAIEKNGKTVSAIMATMVETGEEKIQDFPAYTVSFDGEETRTIEGRVCPATVVPVKIGKKGKLYIDNKIIVPSDISVRSQLYMDKDCKIETNSSYRGQPFSCASPGTYYLLLYTFSPLEEENVRISLRAYYYSSEGRTLTNGKWCATSASDGEDYKIKIEEEGNIVVESDVQQQITLLNSRKEILYDPVEISDKGWKSSYFLKKGTYFIRTREVKRQISKLRYTYAKAGQRPFKAENKKIFTVHQGGYQYRKYKAKLTGYITLSHIKGKMRVVLCDDRKKAISSEYLLHGGIRRTRREEEKIAFGVKKGKTYYLRTENADSLYSNSQFKFTETEIKEKSGASKKKAAWVKSSKNIKGIIPAGVKSVDWYRFKLKKRKNIALTLHMKGCGDLKVTLYDPKNQKLHGEILSGYSSDSVWKSQYKNKLDLGVYYIKIEPVGRLSSGYYSIKWKER